VVVVLENYLKNHESEKDLKKKTSKYGVDYYEFKRNGKKHIAVAAVGHLFNLKQKRVLGYLPLIVQRPLMP